MKYFSQAHARFYTNDENFDLAEFSSKFKTFMESFNILEAEVSVRQLEPCTYKLRIVNDCDPMSPRDWDNVGTMACWHNRYNLGDEQPSDDPLDYMKKLVGQIDDDFEDKLAKEEDDFFDSKDWTRELSDEWDEVVQQRIEEAFDKYYISLPLYLYDHSGITMSTGPFSCPWDSGQVGFIYVSRENAEKEWGTEFPVINQTRTVTSTKHKLDCERFDSLDEIACNYLRLEVEVYDQFLRGDVWGFQLEDVEGETVDSCCGFFGTDWKTSGIRDHISDDDWNNISEITVHGYDGEEIDELTKEDFES